MALAVMAGAGIVALLPHVLGTTVVGDDVERPLGENEMQRLAQAGGYVARVADCYACHTVKGGGAWAGGMPFKTPLGTIYSTNISPDKQFGIGTWTRAEFHRAVRDGIGRNGRPLYPAMPYTSYRKMTPEDVDGLYAYFMTRQPVAVENRRNGLPFPFNIREFVAVWNFLNLGHGGFKEDPSRSPVWNRGRYIVDAVAHCGECHTPRNSLMAMETDKYLKGAVIEGLEAPDITKEGLTRMGFDPQSLVRFMKTGLSAQGAAANQMLEVVHFSTQYMRDEDLGAMAAYLFDLDEMPDLASPPPAPAPVPVPAAIASSAQTTYANLCAGCHGPRGRGIPGVVVPLATNASLRLASPRNLIHAVLHGIPAQSFPGRERMQPMPGFADVLDDQAVADLANWLRARWGGQKPAVTAADVAKQRPGAVQTE